MNRTELDALHGRMTVGEWGLQAFYQNAGTPDERVYGMIVDADSDLCIGIVEEREAGVDSLSHDLEGIVALKNAWPAISAELAAKDAEIARLTAKLAEAERERDAERAAVVAFLRWRGAWLNKADDGLSGLCYEAQGCLESADAIEAGQHRGNG